MAFPTGLPSYITPDPSKTLDQDNHTQRHTQEEADILALATKVGVDGSAVTTTHDYKLSSITSTDKALGRTATQTVLGKTIDLTDNTLTGTTTQFNTALSDGNFATQAGAETLTNKILVDAQVSNSFIDANGNELFKFTATASAVNEITVTNAATGNAPRLSATGGDTNIDVALVPKGTGAVTNGTQKIDWWQEVGRTTLGTAGDTITVSSIPARKYLKIIVSVQGTGGTISASLRMNNDSSANYSYRLSGNGGADITGTSDTGILITGAATLADTFFNVEGSNIASKEKIFGGWRLDGGTAGAANAPNRVEYLGKWANTADQITRVDVVNVGTGDYAIGSSVVVLGHD